MEIYFISGVSGVGKTSVMEILKKDLPEQYVVKDFDERGVPNGGGRHGGGQPWRLSETQYWILEGKTVALEDKTLIVCGLVNPEEIALMPEAEEVDVKIILLDAPGEIIQERLLRRNSDAKVKAGLERTVGVVDVFIKGSSDFAPILRDICVKAEVPVIDTSEITPAEVAKKVEGLLS
jgi:broad-specificity NMP kinase